RDFHVTGVQTCALPIFGHSHGGAAGPAAGAHHFARQPADAHRPAGRVPVLRAVLSQGKKRDVPAGGPGAGGPGQRPESGVPRGGGDAVTAGRRPDAARRGGTRMQETGTNGAAPVIGITLAFDDGSHEESLRPGVAIHQVSAAYAWAVEHAGAAPVLRPLTASEEVARAYVRMVDGIMFSGGGGAVRRRHLDRAVLPDLRALAPRRYRFEAMLLRLALEEDVPVLGICRGHQMIVQIGRAHV